MNRVDSGRRVTAGAPAPRRQLNRKVKGVVGRMHNVKISLVHGNLLTMSCSIAFLKHIEGLSSSPEREADAATGGQIASLLRTKEREKFVEVASAGAFPFQHLYIINFHQDELPFTYSSVDSYARRIIRLARK